MAKGGLIGRASPHAAASAVMQAEDIDADLIALLRRQLDVGHPAMGVLRKARRGSSALPGSRATAAKLGASGSGPLSSPRWHGSPHTRHGPAPVRVTSTRSPAALALPVTDSSNDDRRRRDPFMP